MSITPQPPRQLQGRIHRRRALPMTAAALALAGCGMLPQQAAAPMTSEQQDAQERVKRYQADIELALDKVDRDRLRAAAEKKPVVTVSTPTAAPAAVPAAGRSTANPSSTAPDEVSVTTSKINLASKSKGEPGVTSAAAGSVVTAPAAPPAAVLTAVSVAPPMSVAAPATVSSAAEGIPALNAVNISPLSGDSETVPATVIAPLTPSNTPSAAAMGAMTAAVTPAQMTVIEPPAAAKPTEANLDDALAIVRKNVEEHPTLNSALALKLLNAENVGDVSKKLSAADQKVLSDLVAALEAMQGPGEGSSASGKEAAGATSLAQRAAPLLEAAKNWQSESDLALPRMVLATRVDSFGVFTPVAGTFEQGKRHTVIIYCEVANFAAAKSDDGWFTTKLAQQETLITDDGLLVWRPNAEEIEDRSMNQRHDFYLVKKLTIPETLAAGKYTLRMSVTDRTTNKIAVVSMPIEIVLKP